MSVLGKVVRWRAAYGTWAQGFETSVLRQCKHTGGDKEHGEEGPMHLVLRMDVDCCVEIGIVK